MNRIIKNFIKKLGVSKMKDWDKIGMKQSQELEKKKSIKQKKEETLNFYRRAFCVDGNVKLITKPYNKFEIVAIVELNDSKRGKFYVGILKK